MKLISCDNCAVLLDQDKLPFATDIHEEDGSIDGAKARWHSDKREYCAFVPCPVCQGDILKE